MGSSQIGPPGPRGRRRAGSGVSGCTGAQRLPTARWMQTPAQAFFHVSSQPSSKVSIVSVPHVSKPRRVRQCGVSRGHDLEWPALPCRTLKRGLRSHTEAGSIPAQPLTSCVWPWTSPGTSLSLGFSGEGGCREACVILCPLVPPPCPSTRAPSLSEHACPLPVRARVPPPCPSTRAPRKPGSGQQPPISPSHRRLFWIRASVH